MSLLIAMLLQAAPEKAASEAWTNCLIEVSDREARSSAALPETVASTALAQCQGNEGRWRAAWLARWNSPGDIDADVAQFRESHRKNIVARVARIRAALR